MLELSHLHKAFGENVAVDNLDLKIEAGEIFGLLGPNGAGKTTTVSMAVGLLEPDSGQIDVQGLGSPDQPRVRRRIGVAPQSLALYDDLTGEENLRFFARMHGLTGSRLSDRVQWALKFVNLDQRRRDPVKTYSGGMKRRLNLAAAVAHRPPLLLLDEPTAGVDPQSRNSILEKILELRDEGTTIIYTTHYMEEAQRICDRVAIMDRGRLLAMDSVDGLTEAHGGLSFLRIEDPDGTEEIETDDPLGELRKLMENGRHLLHLSVNRPNLEMVFLNLTGRSLRD